jgi:uncharacterized damage-inducible protein DinB
MGQRKPWLTRDFAFGDPALDAAALLERIRTVPDRLEAATAGLEAERLTTRHEGTWSIQENAGHLLDLEALMATRLDDFLAGREVLTPADVTNPGTEAADHNARELAEVLSAFRRERESLVTRIEMLAPGDLARTALHPRLRTPMTVIDWMLFTAEHDDHHLGRIEELRARSTMAG